MPILRTIIHNNPSSLTSEPPWKALVLSSWLLLGRPAVNASESNCTHYLDARLELVWAEDWSALWAMVRAECDVVQCRMPHEEQLHSRSSHEFVMLLHWHVQVKKDEPWQPPETHRQSQSQSKLFKRAKVSTQQQRLSCQTYSYQKSLSSSPPPSAKCLDSTNLDRSACVLSIGTTLVHWQVTATCLCE